MEAKRRGRPPKVAPPAPANVRVRCIYANIMTSAGKLREGDEAVIPAAEVPTLRGRVEIIE
jgi:hypothetical protein